MAVLLFPDFSNYCLANVIEPMRAVNRQLGHRYYRWHLLTLDGADAVSSSGLVLRAEQALADSPGGACLFVMPSYDVTRHDTAACRRGLRAAAGRFDRLAALDTGSWLLAGAGLLEGRRATIHREEQIALAERFPEVEVLPDRVVRDGPILSCGGAQASFDLVLDMIEQDHGAMMRLEVAALFLDSSIATPDAMIPPPPGRSAEAAMALMLRHLENPLSIPQLAQMLGLSRRLLEERCRARYGFGPRQLYRALRLREARRLLGATGLAVAEVALRSGYADPSAMTRAFRQEFGLSPRQLRQQAMDGPIRGG